MTMRLFILAPQVVFAAQINMASATYPVDALVVDGITTGSITTPRPGQLLTLGTTAGGDDLGRTRIKTVGIGNELFIADASLGTHDGELSVQDDAWVTVYDDRRVWSKIPAIVPDGDGVKWYKDGVSGPGGSTNQPPPVANGGCARAATVDPVSGVYETVFDGTTSFAVATGATITDYEWYVDDGTITGGFSTSAIITATFPPGFRYVYLTVTDSNGVGHSHTHFIPVFVRDPANDATIPCQVESRRLTISGQELAIRVLADIPASTYPDGALVMLWEDEPADNLDTSHMRFTGWIQTDSAQIGATRTGTLKDTVLACVDVLGRLKTLPGFSQEVRNHTTGAAQYWWEMDDANIDKYMHYLLQWHSTALDVADWQWSFTGDDYEFVILGSDAATLYEQVQRVCQAMVPAHHFTCNSLGQMRTRVDLMLHDVADRNAAVQRNITIDDWSQVSFDHQRAPRVRTLRAGALLANAAAEIPAFALAPGDTPGQGESEQDRESQAGLAPSQAVLNAATGHQYARLNAPYGLFTITLAAGDDFGIEPADGQWVAFNITEALAAQRGLILETARFLVREVNYAYNHARTGDTVTVTLTCERETSGTPAKTVVVDVAANVPTPEEDWWGDDGGYWENNFPTETPAADLFYGDPMAYILWDGAHVMRTWDIMASSPTWELVDTGITGTIRDGQYVILSNTAGMWLMTTDAIWWCADIMADTPVWDDVLTLATVQAADAAGSSAVMLKSMFHGEDSNPGFCIVATGLSGQLTSSSYEHAYFWYTGNYGASWTQVDMNAFLYSADGLSRGYTLCGIHGINMHRSSGTIFALRATQRYVSTGRFAVFVSEDYGATWARRYDVFGVMTDTDSGALLDPFPDITDPSWLVRASEQQAVLPRLYKTTDAWATGAQSALPTGYNLVAGVWRPNSRTFDPDHLMAWHRNESTTHAELLETNNGGTSWTSLLNSGLVLTTQSRSQHNSPNGWPAHDQTWALVRAIGSLGAPVIQITEDHFDTLSTREGNLNTLLGGTWVSAYGSGFFLPKLGKNT